MLAAALLLSAFSFAGCDGSGAGERKEELPPAEFTLWGAPSSAKILRDEIDYADKRPAELVYAGVRGEYESYQLIISVEKNVITEYGLEAADLTGPQGAKLDKGSFTVYNQFYTEVLSPTTKLSRIGEYPDALIPQQLAKKAGEMTVKAEENAGLWVTLYIPEDAVPGVYGGTFKFSADDAKREIPVSVTIYDYVLSKESNMQTLFSNRPMTLTQSEGDSTYEMQEIYYDFMLDYRISMGRLPVESLDPAEYVETVKKWAPDPRLTTYVLPTNLGPSYALPSQSEELDRWTEMMLLLAQNSTPTINLFTKLAFYIVDEPDQRGAAAVTAAISEGRRLRSWLETVVAAITADSTGLYDTFKTIPDWEASILDVRNILTARLGADELRQQYNTQCPAWAWGTEIELQRGLDDAASLGAQVWWYGCMSPKAPYPAYHLDDNLLSGRLINWIAQAYGITGQLYWEVSSGLDVYDFPYWKGEYGDPDLTGGKAGSAMYGQGLPAGDGYLIYPGSRYGHRGPLPSMRLMAIRDGMEEYELLHALENRYDAFNAKYSASFDSRAVVTRLYERLHNVVIPTRDIDLFESIRSDLLQAVAQAHMPHGFVIGAVDVENNIAEITMYAETAYSVSVGGAALTAQAGNPYEYRYELDLADATGLTTTLANKQDPSESYTLTSFISNRTQLIQSFDHTSVLQKITVSENSKKQIHNPTANAFSGGSLYVEVASKITGDEYQDLFFVPRFTLDASGFASSIDFTKVNSLVFYAYTYESFDDRDNPSFTVWLTSGSDKYQIGIVHMTQNARGVKVVISFDEVNWSLLGAVDGIAYEFENKSYGSGSHVADELEGTPITYRLWIDNLFVELK
jgi:hypothetical protein